MYFTAKLASAVLAIAASAQASVVARTGLADLSVTLYDQPNFSGASYSPDGLVINTCNSLPDEWLDRAQSLIIGGGYTCIFFTDSGCEGTHGFFSGAVSELYDPFKASIESFLCIKDSDDA